MIDIEILAYDIFDKRLKNIFQPADPTIFPENPTDSCSMWRTSPRRLKSYLPMIDIEI
jgi:hypothetical protein